MKKIFFWLGMIVVFQACRNASEQRQIVHNLTAADVNAEAPYLFDNGKDIILCWTQRDEHDRKNNLLKWTRFDRSTLQFDSIHTVPVSKGLQLHVESMAKVGVFPDGTLMAVYRKKMPGDKSRFGGLIFYTISRDRGLTWSEEIRLVDDTSFTSQSFYDIALLPGGRMGLSWLDSRSRRRGKTLYFAATDSAYRFSYRKPVAFSTCECCRTDLYADATGKIRLAYRNLIEPDEPGFDGHGTTEIRDMYYLESPDTGRTFTKPVPISRDNWHIYGCPHTGPSMAYNGHHLGVIWFTAAQNNPGLFFTKKMKNNLTFEPRQAVSAEGRHPQMVAANRDYYAVYEEYYEKDGKGFYGIMLNRITDDGQMHPRLISLPETRNDHPVIAVINPHKLLVVWVNTDTRNPKLQWKVIKI
ncbi:MAG: exo-alpha-sialidase [Chlorobi bacterium]|nr:exo-alpha-sialidase [Chlorobiota bacterium]